MKNLSGIHPLEYKVVIRPDVVRSESEGGIVFTEDVVDTEQNAQVTGVLVAKGPLAFEGWEVEPLVGAHVFFAKYAGIYVAPDKAVDGGAYRLANDKDIVAIREVPGGC